VSEYKVDKVWLEIRQEPKNGEEATGAAIPVQELRSNHDKTER